MSEPADQHRSGGRVHGRPDGAIYWVIFDNEARMNALDRAMWETLPEIIEHAEADGGARVVVLRGAGKKAFSAGADISEFGTERTGAAAKAYDRLNQTAFDAVSRCAKPTIAMISGFCMGGGLELALCCDLRIGAEGSQFAIPAAKLGIGFNPRWFRPLLAVVSAAKLKDLVFTGRRLDSDQGLAMGLLNELCPPDRLEDQTRNLAQLIAANAPLSIRAAKGAIDAHFQGLSEDQLRELDAMVDACFESDDYKEGQAAFTEKRAPKFHGK